MKYFFDGKKMHTVSEKVKKKFFIKNKRRVYIWPNQTLSKHPKMAIRVYLNTLKEQFEHQDKIFQETLIFIKKLLRQIKKTEKLIKK